MIPVGIKDREHGPFSLPGNGVATNGAKSAMRKRPLRELTALAGIAAGVVGVVMLAVPVSSRPVVVVGAVLLAAGWMALVIVTILNRRPGAGLHQIRAELRAHDDRSLARTRRIETVIEAERAKESQHEYAQERALQRIEARVLESMHSPNVHKAWTEGFPSKNLLFVTSNGAGLGHLTRLMAVADWLPDETDATFLTLSKAYKQVADRGYPIHYFPSAEAGSVATGQWSLRFRRYLQGLFTILQPKVVVFDGTVVYEGLIDVCRGHGIPLVWMQRGCWKPEADARYPARRNAATVADRVIIPGDYGCDELINVGRGVEATRVGPIVLLSRKDLLTADEARLELGLAPDRQHILFNLGGGNLSDPGEHLQMLRNVMARAGSEWKITVVRSPLAEDQDLPDGIGLIQQFPIMRYVRAFDFVVSAAGYNSVQEAAALQVPTILVPNQATLTDDQLRRARSAAEQGWALLALDSKGVAEATGRLANEPGALEELRQNLTMLTEPSGAEEAADVIQDVLKRSAWYLEQDYIAVERDVESEHVKLEPEQRGD